MRETTAGWQHVAWLDASQAAPGHQKRRHCLAGPQTIMWDGIDTEGAALAESPDVFTGGITPFHRALPQVISGEPVPPPYYTIFFRYRAADSDSAEILDEANVKLYVPQVVKVEMTDAAYEEYKTPILYPETFYPHLLGETNDVVGCESNVVLYAGSTEMTLSQVLDSVVGNCQNLVPLDVNLRFTRYHVDGRCKYVTIVVADDINRNIDNVLGFTPQAHCSWPNQNPYGACYVYMDKIRVKPCEEKLNTETGINPSEKYDANLFPLIPCEFETALSGIAIHETGHTLGLVSGVLYGTVGWHNQVNAYSSVGWIMNGGKMSSFMDVFGKSTTPKSWKPRNHEYLRFILPKN